jgi:uncharacterized protein YceH (UPF0502 family)
MTETRSPALPDGPLPPVALRLLGTLAEKERTVPDTYPLSLNALLAGCNQKTSRHPLMELSEAEALPALELLRERGLVSEVSGSRVTRYAHHLDKALAIPPAAAALITVLILRGAQTAGELRQNTERLHAFADISSVEAYLEELAARPAGALVRELPRAPGSRENRWMHRLGPAEEESAAATPAAGAPEADTMAALAERVARLESELAELRAALRAPA